MAKTDPSGYQVNLIFLEALPDLLTGTKCRSTAGHGSEAVQNDPPCHTRVRLSLMGALTRLAIADPEPGLTALVDSLLDAIEVRGGGDLIEDFASAVPVEIIGNLLDIPHAGNALVALQEWPAVKTELLSKQELLAPYVQGLEAYFMLAMDEFLRFESSNQLSNRHPYAAAVRASGGFCRPRLPSRDHGLKQLLRGRRVQRSGRGLRAGLPQRVQQARQGFQLRR